jgi:anaerobic dimethyl sulfoxide reductase subunit C
MRRPTGEWPLVAFTVLGQMSAGMFVALGVARLLMGSAVGDGALVRLFSAPLIVSGLMFAGALAGSTRHLARPWQAWRAVRNLGASWVSLEIALAVGFAATGASFTVVEVMDVGPPDFHETLAGVTASLGVGFVLAMGKVYCLPARPNWNHPGTPLTFFVTAAWLGTLGAAVSLAAAAFPERLAGLDAALAALAGGAAFLSVCDAALAVAQDAIRRRVSAVSSLPETRRGLARQRVLTTGRVVLAMSTALLTTWFAVRRPPLSAVEPAAIAVLIASCTLALTASWIGRASFYSAKPRLGV